MLEQTDHRPYAPPDSPWIMRMRWLDLLFMHWPVPVEALRPHVPDALEIDTFDGTAWLGVIPFEMAGVRGRCLPAVPGLSRFCEMNVRTYVSLDGRPGVWFFTLDAACATAVATARAFFHLNYLNADMSIERSHTRITYDSLRNDRRAPSARCRVRYAPAGAPSLAVDSPFETFLVERYRLYAADARGRIYAGEIHHGPWRLSPATVEVTECTLTEPMNLALSHPAPALHYADAVDVLGWFPRRVH